MTKAERLQSLIDQYKNTIGDVLVIFMPFKGWYLCGEQRHDGDDGNDFMGRNYNEALRWIREMIA